jgi:hypothetical protein
MIKGEMMKISELKNLSKSICLLLHTNGEGQPIEATGDENQNPEALSKRVDLLCGMLGSIGEDTHLGDFTTSLIFYKEGVLVVGSSKNGESVAVASTDSVSGGLILTQLRTLLSQLGE